MTLGSKLVSAAFGVFAAGSVLCAGPFLQDQNPAVNEPDMFNWRLFVTINARARIQSTGSKPSNNAVWEAWADNAQTFPAKPNPVKGPDWPGDALPTKTLTPSLQQEFRTILQNATLSMLGARFGERKATAIPQIAQLGSQEVRRNRSSFDFIMSSGLYYTEGLQAAFQSGGVNFHSDAVEVKAEWKPIQPNQRAAFHWNYDASGTLYGLVALHIMSKAVPNWTWATWEHVSNPARCDDVGCHDKFGVVPHDVAKNTKPNQGYPPGELTPELLALCRQGSLAPEWQNYRLKGSQVDFTDATGTPTLLGNSITETGFVPTSSCITCHAQASVDTNGAPRPRLGFEPNGQSPNGPPLPVWFYQTNTNPWTPIFRPIDFVWSIEHASSSK